MSERDNIMGRICQALRVPAPPLGLHGTTRKQVGSFHQWMPPSGKTFVEQVERFRAQCAELQTDFRLVSSQDEAHLILNQIATVEKWKRIATHNGSLTNAATYQLGLNVLHTTGGYVVKELETCEAGITECDALIVQTGSVVVSSRNSGGRALSVLPPHHVVLARCEQLVENLTAGLESVQKKYGAD